MLHRVGSAASSFCALVVRRRNREFERELPASSRGVANLLTRSAQPVVSLGGYSGSIPPRCVMTTMSGVRYIQNLVHSARRPLCIGSAFFIVVQAGCSSDKLVEPVVPKSLEANSPVVMSATVGTPVARQPSVIVKDQRGVGVAGVEVRLAVSAGGGTIAAGSVITNSAGIATAGVWTLGTTAGNHTLTASSGTLAAVIFTASATAGPASLVRGIIGNSQSATAASSVGILPSLVVTDANGNPVSGVLVVFAVGVGGGTLTGGTQTTNRGGMATVADWTLGATPGLNTLTAAVAGLPGLTFVATGLPRSPNSPAFSLVVSNFRVSLFRRVGSPYFQYAPSVLELTETSGNSAATLIAIDVDAPGGSRDGDCTPAQTVGGQVVRAGGKRDLVASMGYCIPYAVSASEVSQVSFTTTFMDDQGRMGQIQRAVSVTNCTLAGKEGGVSCE